MNVKPRSTECHWHLTVYSVSSWLRSTLDVYSVLSISPQPVTPSSESHNNTPVSDNSRLESHCTGQLFLTVLETLMWLTEDYCHTGPSLLCLLSSWAPSHRLNVTRASTFWLWHPGVSRVSRAGDVCKFLLRFLLSISPSVCLLSLWLTPVTVCSSQGRQHTGHTILCTADDI